MEAIDIKEIESELMIENHTRFSELPWYLQGPQDIVLGGAGGIGSWVALYLGRAGHRLYVYDFDTIEKHNMGGQLYGTSHIGTEKTEALKNVLTNFAENENVTAMGRYEQGSMSGPIVIAAFDNMAARRQMFEDWCELEDKQLFIDGRMLAENGMVYTVTPDRIEAYRATLFDDSEVADQPCTAKSTSHCGSLIGVLITSTLNNYLSNKTYGDDFRDVPFEIKFGLQLMTFEVA